MAYTGFSAQSDIYHEVKHAVAIIPDKLYFVVVNKPVAAPLVSSVNPTTGIPTQTPAFHVFNIDNILLYEPFYADFGPLNLACVHRFIQLLEQKLKSPKLTDKRIYYCCGNKGQQKSNAAVLIGAFQVIILPLAVRAHALLRLVN